MATKLLQMGEEQINQINKRTYNDQVSNSQRELAEAERQLNEVRQVDILSPHPSGYQSYNDGPSGRHNGYRPHCQSGEARARLQTMKGTISPSSPQFKAMAQQVAALESQVAGQSAKIGGQAIRSPHA
jgi:capsular polysaccharide transport system permease protein